MAELNGNGNSKRSGNGPIPAWVSWVGSIAAIVVVAYLGWLGMEVQSLNREVSSLQPSSIENATTRSINNSNEIASLNAHVGAIQKELDYRMSASSQIVTHSQYDAEMRSVASRLDRLENRSR